MPKSAISIQNLNKRYMLDGVQIQALCGVDLLVEQGDFLAIMGPSGSGKSTLMNILGCLDAPDDGNYKLNGMCESQMNNDDLARIRNREIGFVFQSFNLLARTTAIENVEMPLIYAGVSKTERRKRATEFLHMMGLGERLNHYPSQLSGGQQQRVSIARALVTNPSILLADEPTGNVDTHTSQEIMDILCQLNKKGLTIVLITHEAEIAERAERCLYLRDGCLRESQ